MSALPQPRLPEVSTQTTGARKPIKRENVLNWERYRTDYKADTGYSPAYHDAVRLKPQLCGESVVMVYLIDFVNMRSYGRSRPKKQKERFEWTDLLTTEELAAHCLCKVREVQRQVSEMEDRGMLAVKRVKGGLLLSLRYENWPNVEPYAVWKQKRKVTTIDESELFEPEPDEEPAPVSKDAVHLFKRPPEVRPGRATRAVPVAPGIKEFVFINTSSAVDASCTAVIQSGRLIVSAAFKTVESTKRTKSENTARNDAFRNVSATKQTKSILKTSLPSGLSRAAELVAIVNPHVSPYSLAVDVSILRKAHSELGDMPDAFLSGYVADRASRGGISGLAVVPLIVRDARLNWEAAGRPATFKLPVKVKKSDAIAAKLRADRERLKSCGKN